MKGYIFDLDGVIVDTAKFHFLAWSEIAKELGFTLTLEQNEQLKGISRIHSLEKIIGWANKRVSNELFNDFATRKNAHYLSFVEKMTEKDILLGVLEYLEKIKSQGNPIALGSASKNATFILKQIGIIDLFDVIIDGNSVSKAKPDPQVFTMAGDKMNIPYKDCIVFEDSQAGIQAGNTAGMITVGIGKAHILGEADYIFSDFNQVLKEFPL